MREIEFKAYIKDIKKVVDVLDIDFLQETISFLNPQDTKYSYRKFEQIELMQYIGIKDKNEKEIYEGDLLMDCNNNKIYRVDWATTWYSYQLVTVNTAKEEHCCIWPNGGKETGYFLSDLKRIGNIYENPEPLQENASL